MAAPGTYPDDSGLNNTESKPDRWRRIENLFNAAADLAEPERTAFLNRACTDPDLRQEVDSLLASAEHTLGFLQQPVQNAAQNVAAQSAPVQRVGPYEFIRLLGSGGMGDVYLAERADQQFRRNVAVKLMRTGLEQSQILLPRFSTERQILANLDHPNIARLLDGGLTPHGLPYLVMEYVEGLPIDEYCAENNLSVSQKLVLFQSLCAAVEYAHKHFVVHRDIKPQNVLVTADGVPKLLDFGIAKLLDPDKTSMEPTRRTERMMTPEYASPEQLLGKAITTASDVYGLGVLLYELLAGRRPFRVRTGSNLALATLICEHQPDAPGLGQELDSIILKAIAKDPAARYDSAAQLAEDLAAYLGNYPLLSHPSSWAYQARKWVGRHKQGTAAALITFISLLGLIIALAVIAHRAREERLRAEREASFLVGMFKAATPEVAEGRTVTARDLLDQGAKRVDRELGSVPTVQASMLSTIVEAYVSLGLYGPAKDLAERAYQLRLKTSGPDRPEIADALFMLADLTRKEGEYAKAEPLFRDLVALRKKTVGDRDLAYATGLGGLGECLYQEGKDTEAESLLQKALAIDRSHGPDYGEDVRNYLALELERRGEYTQAGALLQEAVAIGARTHGVNNPEYAISLHNLASALIDQGDLNGAEARLRETLAIRRKVLGNDHPMLTYTLNNLGYVLLEKGNAAAAEPFLRESLDLNRRRFGPDHPQIVASLNNLARLQQAQGNYTEAAKTYDRALVLLRKAGAFTSWTSSQIVLNLGLLEFDQGHYGAAETWAHQALEMKIKLGGENSLALDGALIDLAQDQLFQGDAQGAEPLLRQALEIREKKYPPKHPLVVAAQVRLGESLIAEGLAGAAEPILRQAVSSARTAPFPLLNWQIAEAESALAACLNLLHRGDEAQRLEQQSQAGLAEHPRRPFRKPAVQRLQAVIQLAHKAF